MYKRDIINALFVACFPIYGIGNYVSASMSPSLGYLISIAPLAAIIVFYGIDLLSARNPEIRLNGNYLFMVLFLISTSGSLFIALAKGLPEANATLLISKSILVIAPFHAFLAVLLYNDRKGSVLRLVTLGLSFLLAVNLMGSLAGITNETHSMEGRLNFPFLDGFYSGASLLAILNLLLLYYLRRNWSDPFRFASLAAFFVLNLGMFFLINSRLTILIFIMVLGLTLAGVIRMRLLYLLSMFTIPILLGSGLVIYKILQLPGLTALMQRVDVEDVTTFNGRAFLWRDGMDWLLSSQQGWMWGNGYRGHYFLGLISDVAKLWNEKNVHHMHLHSTSLEILVSQGVLVFALFAYLLYRIYTYFKSETAVSGEDVAFFPVVVFLLFILQVDGFVYLDSFGFLLFALFAAKIAIKAKQWPAVIPHPRVSDGLELSKPRYHFVQ